jgi:Protein of unknown function (DUF998)
MAFIICNIAIVYLIAGNIYFGNHIKGYSHIKHTISELGETGSIFEKQVSFGLFLPTGILLAIAGLVANHNINALGLALSLAIGYIVAAFFPCDPGSPSSGTWKQQLHNMGGFIEYAGSIVFIMKAAEDDLHLWFISFKIIGYIVIICVTITSIPKNPVRGLAQRIAELFLFGCLLHQLY